MYTISTQERWGFVFYDCTMNVCSRVVVDLKLSSDDDVYDMMRDS